MNPLLQSPLLLNYHGVAPALAGPPLASGVGSAVLGRVTLGAQAWLGDFAVLRADGHRVDVGGNFYIGSRGTVHISHELYGTTIGDGVTVGANAIVHACTVGDGCVVMDGAIVLDGAVLGAGSVLAPGSVVFDRKVMPPGFWCEGVPAIPLRPVGATELALLHQRIRDQPRAGPDAPHGPRLARADPDAPGYIAGTVTGAGQARLGEGSSLWFGCIVEAPLQGIDIGAGTNVQDNTILRGTNRPVVIGAGSTIGHNVTLHDCTVGARTLIGMGSRLAPGTVVLDDVLLGGGSTTEPGQVLESGWLWRGRPALPVSRLSERRLHIIQDIGTTYVDYAKDFRLAQESALGTGSREAHMDLLDEPTRPH